VFLGVDVERLGGGAEPTDTFATVAGGVDERARGAVGEIVVRVAGVMTPVVVDGQAARLCGVMASARASAGVRSWSDWWGRSRL
jgi:hypothetical protein